jgi:hypothetical protein
MHVTAGPPVPTARTAQATTDCPTRPPARVAAMADRIDPRLFSFDAAKDNTRQPPYTPQQQQTSGHPYYLPSPSQPQQQQQQQPPQLPQPPPLSNSLDPALAQPSPNGPDTEHDQDDQDDDDHDGYALACPARTTRR